MNARLVSAIAALAVIVLPMSASAQRADEGYLPDRPHPQAGQAPVFDPYPASPATIGGSLGLGASAWSFDDVDRVFFEPNGAAALGTVVPAGVDVAGWVELQRSMRVGLQLMTLFGGDGRSSHGATSGGLLFEAGGGWDWYGWGGVVLGLQGIRANSKDDTGQRYEYQASGLMLRVQGSLERALTDQVRLRLTPWVGFGQVMDERFTLPAEGAALPVDSEFRFLGGGVFLGIGLAAGR